MTQIEAAPPSAAGGGVASRWLPALLLLFIGSGSAALIYEVVWFQLLELVIGSSAVSMGVLLGTFMGGMCLGSLLLPRFMPADTHPLRMYAWLDANAQSEKKDGDTAEQFYYKARKKAIGPFKKECWGLPADVRAAIGADLQATFAFLFEQLKVNGTADLVRKTVQAPEQHHTALAAVGALAEDDPDAGE